MVGTSLENGSGLSLSTKVLLWLHHATAKAFGNPRQQDLWRCAIGTWWFMVKKHRKTIGKWWFNGGLMGFYGGLMGFYGGWTGYNGGLMGFYGIPSGNN